MTLVEAAELAQREEDLWHDFEPGNEIYSRVPHGSVGMFIFLKLYFIFYILYFIFYVICY